MSETVPPRRALNDLERRWVKALLPWLASLDASAPLVERIDQLVAGMDWLRGGGRSQVHMAVRSAAKPFELTRRLRLLLQTLDQEPTMKQRFVDLLRSVLLEVGGTTLFETGLPNDRGFYKETIDRVARRFLPTPRDPRDLGELVFRLFVSSNDALWLRELPAELVERLVALIDSEGSSPLVKSVSALREAAALIAMRVTGLGLTAELRARSEPTALRESPFYRLARACEGIAEAGPFASEDARAVSDRIADCRGAVPVVLRHLEEFGVSVDVVYRVEVIQRSLDRLSALIPLIALDEPKTGTPLVLSLLADLVDARVRDRSLRDLLRNNLHLLARKIIERTGQTGEHYITATRREYARMLYSAGGGGVLTAITCAMKYFILWGHFPLFVEGAFAASNYALSFLVMQILGFTLATKQPSMTAAALAGALDNASRDQSLDDMVTLIARTTRSQLAAAAGNILLVIPAALLLDRGYRALSGHHFFDSEIATHTLQSTHPYRSGTIYFAALTGVFLWLSSVGAGWLENWAVYRRLPEALTDSPALRRLLGTPRAAALGRWLPRNLSGIGGNISLGFLMGMMPVFGKFLGLPLEVRHVTLSTGALTLAMCSLGVSALAQSPFIAAAVGIAIIGILNFGVSFALALAVALRARAIDRPWRVRLLGALFTRFKSHPLEFFFPPKTVARD